MSGGGGGNVQISFSWARAKVEESEKRVVFLRVGAGLPPHVFPRGGGVRLDMDLMMNTKAWGGGEKRFESATRRRRRRCGPDKTSKKSKSTKMSVLMR